MGQMICGVVFLFMVLVAPAQLMAMSITERGPLPPGHEITLFPLSQIVPS